MKVKLLVLFLMAVLLVSTAGFASITSADSSNQERVNIMVRFDNPANKDTVKAFALAGGGRVKYDWSELNMIAIRNVLLSKKEQISIIKGVKEIYVDELKYPLMLDESAYLINSSDVWSEGVTGNGVRVCIVDTGVGPNPNINVVAEYDFYNNDPDATDDHGHGTHCAGIVASTHSTYKGNSYGADIMAAKTINEYGGGYESDTVDGILWCAKGPDGTYGTGDEADVISISLGFSYHTGTCDSQPAANAANTAFDNGVFVVAASGNNCYDDKIGNPACGSDVMAVGAVYDESMGSISWWCNYPVSYCTDSTTYPDKVVCFSNGNDQLDVVAPGSVITSLAPTTLDPDGIADMSGTSMSTPHVAGIGALLLEEDSTLTPQDVRMVISNTSVDLGYPWNRQGFGRVDAYAAWQAVSGGCTSNSDCYDGNECTYDICNNETGECSNPAVPDNTACTGGVCCSGVCSAPTCSVNGDCDDGESCTADICYSAGTCSAYCENTWPNCNLSVSDGCCGPTCDWTNDIDCSACGDGYCEGSSNGEDCDTCPVDCIGGQGGTCEACWKGICDGSCHPVKEGPDCSDCASSYCCGDGTCEGAEDINNCQIDCECTSDEDCNDGEPCTTDTCDIGTGLCSNTWPSCGLSDGCCGPICTPENDTDCTSECIPNGGFCNCNDKCGGKETHETCPWDCP